MHSLRNALLYLQIFQKSKKKKNNLKHAAEKMSHFLRVNRQPSQDFNLHLLCPCLSVGVQRLTRGQGSLLMEKALQVTLEQLAEVTGSLPVPHQSFLPPPQPQPYCNQLGDVYGEISCWVKTGICCSQTFSHKARLFFFYLCIFSCLFFLGAPCFYLKVLSLCRALSQYLLSISQLPPSLHIPSDKEHLITTFTCTATEVQTPGEKHSVSSRLFLLH